MEEMKETLNLMSWETEVQILMSIIGFCLGFLIGIYIMTYRDQILMSIVGFCLGFLMGIYIMANRE